MPLIDVIFLLLTFFFYAVMQMAIHRGVRVNLPSGRGGAVDRAPVVITLAADGGIMVDGRVLPLDEAVRETARLALPESRPVLIGGDRTASLGGAVTLLAALRDAGIAGVSFQVRADSSPLPP